MSALDFYLWIVASGLLVGGLVFKGELLEDPWLLTTIVVGSFLWPLVIIHETYLQIKRR